MPTPVTPVSIVGDVFDGATAEFATALPVLVVGVMGISAIFWAARVALKKTGLGKGAKI